MRLYNGKTIKNLISRQVAMQAETRDAVLWDIDTENQICRVKIQGSTQLITAHFPRNWQKTPYWLKCGNAVSVRHRSGVRGYVEVVGEGRAIPSPIEGGGNALPETSSLPDMVLTGMQLFATDPATMYLLATSGTYRISGTVYVFDPSSYSIGDVVMDAEPVMVMESGTVMLMDTVVYTIELDPAPAAGYFRYDLLCVGADGELDYIPGTAAASDPQKPALPAGHVMVGKYVLVMGGATSIGNTDIGKLWTERKVVDIALTYDDTHEWSESDPETTRTIKMEMIDQYGAGVRSAYTLQIEKYLGSGTLYSEDSGWSAGLVTQSILNASSYTFIYKRNQSQSEISPILVASWSNLTSPFRIELLDVNGYPI
jgi:hypothetical protein